MMKLLLINPNTSDGVTRRIDAAAQEMARDGDRFVAVSAASGVPLIVSSDDVALAAKGVEEAAQEALAEMDGIIVGSFGDTAIDRVRALYPTKPVLGLGSASTCVAGALGGNFAIASFSAQLIPSLRTVVEEQGLGGRLVDVFVTEEPDMSEPGAVYDLVMEDMTHLCRTVAERHGVSSIILGGGPLAGLAPRIAQHVPCPLIDGTRAAIGMMRSLVPDRDFDE